MENNIIKFRPRDEEIKPISEIDTAIWFINSWLPVLDGVITQSPRRVQLARLSLDATLKVLLQAQNMRECADE